MSPDELAEVNYQLGRDNLRPVLEEFRGRALEAEAQVAAIRHLCHAADAMALNGWAFEQAVRAIVEQQRKEAS